MKTKKIIISIGVGVIVLMGIFPPWIARIRGVIVRHGYAFIFNPPQFTQIDISTLIIQWVIVAIICGFLIYILEKKANK
ncbi:MAG: hypothetical protein NTU69_08175 [Proteobacteria bacterium]|nr:hypothetical protein [Pseudomonadota bacterium]